MESTLFIPERHEALSAMKWDANMAKAAIKEIVRDTEAHFDDAHFWPAHKEDDWNESGRMLSLFWGAASTVWGLMRLQELGAVHLSRAYSSVIPKIFETYLRHPDTGKSAQVAPGLLFGKLGYLLLQFRFGDTKPERLDLINAIEETIRQPELEQMWGAPGAILACEWLHAWTGEPVWNELKLKAHSFLRDHLVRHEECGAWVWVQDLYGEKRQYLGAVHGAAGNYQAMLLCEPQLSDKDRIETRERALEFLSNTSITEGDFANWPASINSSVRRCIVQWCHGAVGVVTSLIDPLYSENPEIFTKAGNLIWAAGPLTKHFGLCHGSAGNGYAFLKLYHATRDEVWLERARAFAMHALAQSDAEFEKHGRRRFTVLTGDLGLALFLQACLDRTSAWPFVDDF
jgi:hypothetical protein